MPYRLLALLVAALSLIAVPAARSQDNYPNRQIRIIVPLAPGGGLDTLARVLAQKLTTRLGQTVIVENRTGAAGNIGAEAVYRADPDGYTLMFTQPGPLTVSKALYGRAAFEAEEFVPIGMASLQDIMLAVNPELPVKNLQELIAYAKANPGKLNYGSSGAGSAPHLAAELFKSMAKIDMVHVPFKGAAESMLATVSGQVHLTFFAFSTALANAKDGKLRAIGVGGSKRNPLLPNVPSISEALPGYLAVSWTAMMAPPKTPPAIAQKLQQTMAEVMKEPDVRARLIDQGDQVFDIAPAQMPAFLDEDRKRWGDLIRSVGIKAE
jgi:tripartite-type tricarboxylate transporter receptor subunit TctC